MWKSTNLKINFTLKFLDRIAKAFVPSKVSICKKLLSLTHFSMFILLCEQNRIRKIEQLEIFHSLDGGMSKK